LNREIDNKIKKAFERKNIVWRKHALIRMMERDISRNDVFNAISNGKIIETYPDIKPYPGYLIFGQADKKMLHTLLSWDEDEFIAYIITVYIPDADHFQENGKTRKER
jgi:hypothetical protein